jgi:hypothetical protein
LYSKIDLDLLFNKITADENFPKDNFIEPDIINAKNAFKSRALSFEYRNKKSVSTINRYKKSSRNKRKTIIDILSGSKRDD